MITLEVELSKILKTYNSFSSLNMNHMIICERNELD